MKLSRFLVRLKSEVPSINQIGATDDQLTDILNEGVDKVNVFTKVYKGYTDFAIEAEKQIYNLSTVVPTFLGISKPGVFFKDSNSAWQVVYPKTLAWLSKTYPTFLNASSVAVPKWYWQEGDDLGFHNKPSTSLANGCRIYHLKKGTPMSSGDHYPFTGSTTQITAFEPLDDGILAYAKWQLTPAFGKMIDIDLGEQRFLKECRKGAKQIKRRPDLTLDSSYGIRI